MKKETCITIGSYDGLHLGHLEIIKNVKEIAKNNNLNSLLLYFPIPPKFYISKKIHNNLITLPNEREELILKTGIDDFKSIYFDEKFSCLKAKAFLDEILLSKYKVKALVVGKDFAFGQNREGNIDFLEKYCKEKNILFKVIEYVKLNEHKVSSSLIRNFLHLSKIEEALFCLSRPYFINGKVIKGAGLGRKLGFPTANLLIDERKILPKGVFVGKCELDNKSYDAVINIGNRPTIKTLDSRLLLEVHILNFNKDIYSKNLKVNFYHKIRDEINFNNINELIYRINQDIKETILFFKNK